MHLRIAGVFIILTVKETNKLTYTLPFIFLILHTVKLEGWQQMNMRDASF